MLVADGRYGGYLNRTSKIWDNVALQIIIEEAGGVFTDFFGKPVDYTNPLTKVNENFTMCAARQLFMSSSNESLTSSSM
jgi:myo-inositol-1(or 4)-monophosphatase